ncbi:MULTISPECIES: hypothetical protein [unclassified Crossiella]|uniref:hypothetical protein n=1 Tax=unclassified Crossiella TaxID=2620835 RepID=UPI001FFF45AB|nr:MULTISPECIES: hypothetical protein [unclassified Crossiella]MCK2242334.1 hypothetical protein [Crossiella sp. S99.2]MCK2254635.1 hypothetical protein [Crossiella sp. S99.1]
MNPEEAARLLSHVASLDARIPRPSAEVARSWAAVLTAVPLPAAWTAANEHYRRSRDPLRPEVLVSAWRGQRHREGGLAVLAVNRISPEQAAAAAARGAARVRAAMGWADRTEAEQAALDRPCPVCEAAPRQRCRRLTRSGDHTDLNGVHDSRFQAEASTSGNAHAGIFVDHP